MLARQMRMLSQSLEQVLELLIDLPQTMLQCEELRKQAGVQVIVVGHSQSDASGVPAGVPVGTAGGTADLTPKLFLSVRAGVFSTVLKGARLNDNNAHSDKRRGTRPLFNGTETA
jgi:hypothetical protein